MTYIPLPARGEFEDVLDDLITALLNTEHGVVDVRLYERLSYVMLVVLRDLVEIHGENYQFMQNLMGALECTKQEFYRTTVAPYHNEKMIEHGDI